jgi:hypothetical protein
MEKRPTAPWSAHLVATLSSSLPGLTGPDLKGKFQAMIQRRERLRALFAAEVYP